MLSLFDTLAYTRRLKTAGVDGAQAEAFADALQVAFHEGVATKSDIGGVRADTAILKSDTGNLKEDLARIKADIADIKADVAVLKTDVAILKVYSARHGAKLNFLQWAVGLHTLLSLAMAARLFGVF